MSRLPWKIFFPLFIGQIATGGAARRLDQLIQSHIPQADGLVIGIFDNKPTAVRGLTTEVVIIYLTQGRVV